MATIRLTENDIRNWIDTTSSERGYSYFENESIRNARCQGMVLKACCEGKLPQPYLVRVTFDGDGISEAHCSCPVGGGGRCKHVAALLFTYLNRPGGFRDVEELDTALGKRTKKELIVLIKQMVARQPKLEVLLETPLPGGKRHTSIDPETYRRQAASAFYHTRYGWGEEGAIADELNSIIELGKGFADQEDYASAAIVYKAVSQEVLSQYDTFHDEEGELCSVVNDCVEWVAQCLSNVEDIMIREMILHTLFEIYLSDVDFGGIDMGEDVPNILLKQTGSEEKRTIASWVRVAMPAEKKDCWTNQWERQQFGCLLLDLEKEILGDKDYIRLCRETGQSGKLVERLLTMGQCDEAITETEKAKDYEAIQLADIFVAKGYGKKAEHLMVKRAKSTEDSRIFDWLKTHYTEQGDTTEALAMAQRLLCMCPELANYKEVSALAQKVCDWEKLRIQILTEMANSKEHYLLTKIYLEEGDIDQALEVLKCTQASDMGLILRIEVARIAEKKRPHAAIKLYQQLAEEMIHLRGRRNYQRACAHLSRARNIYKCVNQDEIWTHYIGALRKRNCNLSALMDELSKAGI